MKLPPLSWYTLLPFFLIFLSFNTQFISSTECFDGEKSLLLELRSSLNYSLSQSSKLVKWGKESADCCQWSGVDCNSSTRHVTGLDLSSEGISGGITQDSSSLFQLRFLERLNLADNSFNDTKIPLGLSKLTTLRHLNLSNAGFGGQVPLELSQLRLLITLDLSSLSYLGLATLKLENPNLGMFVRNFSSMRELYLDGVNLSAQGSEWCRALAGSLPNLQVASLSNCGLSGEIDQSLSKIESLSVIRVNQNNLSAQVPSFIVNFKNVTQLVLSSCGLIGTFPVDILKVSTLRTLDLSDNAFLQGSLPEFNVNGSLETLILSGTNFSGKLPASVGNLTSLLRLDLSNCSFHGELPPSVAGLEQLVYLDLSSNGFVGSIPSFSSAKNLTQLVLSHNDLSGSIDSTNWRSLSNLANLDLRNNSLNGSLPMSLFSIPSLQKLQLLQNGFSGQLNVSLEISSPTLDILDLSNNQLDGEIPESVFRSQGLKSLILFSNNFSGSLDLNLIQQLKNLSALDLSDNNLSINATVTSANLSSFPQLRTLRLGSCNLYDVPHFLKTQSKLTNLDLSNNHISGSIPKWIWEIGGGALNSLNLSCNYFRQFDGLEQTLPDTPNLSILDLHSNKLQGKLPIFPPRAAYLDFSDNSFTSFIPTQFSSFHVVLSLKSNNISGGIPESMCNATYLRVLDLSENQLDGTIPRCLIALTQTLVVLNLKGNKLSGSISDTFPEGCTLRTLDVSGNSLEGRVPRSLAKCRMLEVLNLGKNKLIGTFPSWLGNLSNLSVLVLRSNRLSGSIACTENSSTWPMLQLVDLASNYLHGELESLCFAKWQAMMTHRNQSEVTYLWQYKPLHYSPIYYQDVVTIIYKGLEIELLRILTVFTSIDFSNNNFTGEIPKTLGSLNGLVALNLSHNALSGDIPSSIGNLRRLESLDLSYNQLTGQIPHQLLDLNFLEVLDLSFNNLVGMIPQGKQFSTFENSSFEGNKGLCGSPLPQCRASNCTTQSPVEPFQDRNSNSVTGLDWQFILTGVGFGAGAGIVVATLMFWRKGRKWYDKQVDKFVCAILSPFGIVYTGLGGGESETEDNIGNHLFDIIFSDEDGEDDTEDECFGGHFCVFCSKLDAEIKKVIHNPACTCHGASPLSTSSSSSSSN